ncbi:MAG TPA: hypothetical protein DEQ38_00090 [Elusimicrobia bacterium]|nr:hypothetical protein [Elusimicrobiota bacterium]
MAAPAVPAAASDQVNTPVSVPAGETGAPGEKSRYSIDSHSAMPTGVREVYVDGALTFKYDGRKYALKVIFSRAKPEPGTTGYKVGVLYNLSDYTDPENIKVWPPMDPKDPQSMVFNNPGTGTTFRINVDAKQVEVLAETNGKYTSYRFKISKLFEAWRENARNYRVRLGAHDWHFVPQVVFKKHGADRHYLWIYVISGKEPFDAKAGLPLDAVMFFDSIGGWWGWGERGHAFSMATGLEISTLGAGKGELKVEEMSVMTMYGHLDGELNGSNQCLHYNCEKRDYPNSFNDW